MSLRAVLLLTFALSRSFAWTQSGVSFMVHAGGNITVHTDPLGRAKGLPPRRAVYGPGYGFGTMAELRGSAATCFVLGLSFDSRSTGYAFDEGQSGYPPDELVDGLDRGERTVRCQMVELPVMIGYRGWSGLRLEAGFQLGRLFFAQRIERGDRLLGGTRLILDERETITRELAAWESALVAGALIEGPHRFHALIRYVHGLTNIDEGSGSPASYARQIQVGLVYAFGAPGAQERTAM